MTPAQLDAILPRLQVVARASPRDKFLLVSRLNGCNLPENEEEWKRSMGESNRGQDGGYEWEKHRDMILPGYREEWQATRPDGANIVGVTGDGSLISFF